MTKSKKRAPSKKPGTVKKVATLRKKFKRVHEKGVAALEAGDFNALGEAIDAERDIIRSQKKLIEESTRGPRRRDR